MVFCLLIIFKINFKKYSGIPSQCQIVWIQIRPNTLVQTACKGYQQRTLVGKELSWPILKGGN